MQVIATAGHVDHGKSTLVRALTGMEPDRLEEERRRGLTIELGFAWTRLPSGESLAFVDVPGHERFLATMLAGGRRSAGRTEDSRSAARTSTDIARSAAIARSGLPAIATPLSNIAT